MTDSTLLVSLQTGIPLCRCPFAVIAEECGLSEFAVIDSLERLFADGTARRFGAVFDVRRLGYISTLCALTLTETEREIVIPRIVPHQGITHCYLRGWPDELNSSLPGGPQDAPAPNIWFTFAALADSFNSELQALRSILHPHRLIVLPAVRRFKIDVVFDPRTRDRSEAVPQVKKRGNGKADIDDRPVRFSSREKDVIRLMQGSLPVCSEPFTFIAEQTGYSLAGLLDLLRRWQESGVIRRIGIIVRHHQVGFKANGMCVWKIPEDRSIAAGRTLAEQPEVTHCYERAVTDDFPYNIYAMIHTDCWENTRQLFERIGSAAGLNGGRLLCSLQEYKKTSPRYFSEETDEIREL